MMFMPSTPSAHHALASRVGFALLALSAGLAAYGMVALSDMLHVAPPLMPGLAVALVGLAIGGRRLWPAVVLGTLIATALRPVPYALLITIVASCAEAALAVFASDLLFAGSDAPLARPSPLHLLAIGGGLIVVCGADALAGGMLQPASFDAAAVLRAFAVLAPVQVALAAVGLAIGPYLLARRRKALPAPDFDARYRRMTAFVADAPVAIAALDRDLRYIVVSHRYLQQLRIENAETILGRTPAEVLPAYALHLGDGPVRALAGAKASCAESCVTMADRTSEYLRSELQPWHDGDGLVGGVMVYGEITTENVRSVAALEDAETRYRAVFEQAAAGFARVSLDGRFLEVNDRFCEISGHERAALLTKSFRDITHPLDLARDTGMLQALVSGDRDSFVGEKRYVTRHGDVVWINLSAAVVRDRDGRPLYATSSIQNITQRKEAQASLAKSEMRLRLAQSAAGAGLWEIDADRKTIIASGDMLRMHGIPPDRIEEIPLREWRALFDKATRAQFDAASFGSADVENHEIVYAIDLPDGTKRWIRSIGRTYETSDKRKRVIGLAIDVTAEQEAQADMKRAQATMLRVSHLSAMSSVSATLAHELNQPLAAIVNYIQVCVQMLKAEGAQHSPQLLDAIQRAQAQAMRAGGLVQKMRTLTTSNTVSRRRQPIGTIVENACALIAHEAVAEHVLIHRCYDQGDDEVYVDRPQIEQALLGILHNAIESMHGHDSRHAEKRIDIDVDRRGDTLAIRIADTGPGLPESAQQQLFEPFANTAGRGSGLALPVCRTIVEAHDGKLTVDFPASGGAAFLITLPIAPPASAARHQVRPEPRPDADLVGRND